MNEKSQATFSVNANNNQVKSRTCVFINSNDPSVKNQMINNLKPFIKPPFPPAIDPHDLITLLPNGKTSKAPNAFLIYRKAFIDAARKDGYSLPMTVISTMASQSWMQESEIVKNEYKQLAKDAFDYRNEIVPKSERRKKRGKWNIISFSKPTRKTPIVKSQKSQKSENKQIIELPSPPISSPEPEIDNTFNNTIQTTELRTNLIPELPSNLTPELSSNLDVYTEWANFYNTQSFFSSPDLSVSGNSSPELNNYYEFDLGITSSEPMFADFLNTQVQIEQPQMICPLVNNMPLLGDTHDLESTDDISLNNSLIGGLDFHSNFTDTTIDNFTFPVIYQNISYEMGFDYSFIL
ncbi:16027_t:CDS:1 [Dentiscutata erythropus]|uniref:16027_t:CDS:1 n=1 Tax=Dentiscutata erythropus TaxID=1348616 RepID=A0A9N8W958_9GLOM|nr:16027_t:CDS:1 [Dentiscutata erythropus]